MFLYADIEWSSGSGAVAGINAGDGINHIIIPGSRTSSILNIEETSNVGVPGIWIFRVGEGTYVRMHVRMYVGALKCCECVHTDTVNACIHRCYIYT